MKLWASKRKNARYILTATRPERACVLGTRAFDYYTPPGDPIGVDVCEAGFEALTSMNLDDFGQVRIELTAKVCE